MLIILDGGTCGPAGTDGEIGRAIRKPNMDIKENMKPFVRFEPIQSNNPVIDNIDLYTDRQDQMMVYDFSTGITYKLLSQRFWLIRHRFYENVDSPKICNKFSTH